MHLNSYNSLYLLYEKGHISLDEWSKDHSMNSLNYDPLNKLVKLDGETIYFRYDMLNLLTEKDMYSWFYQIVEALKQNIKN